MSDHIGEPNAMTDHLGDANKLVCVHCGLPFSKTQNGIDCYSCGSSYCEAFRPQWARSMTCLELQNGQLQERIKRLEEAGDWAVYASDREDHIRAELAWRKAKEAKP